MKVGLCDVDNRSTTEVANCPQSGAKNSRYLALVEIRGVGAGEEVNLGRSRCPDWAHFVSPNLILMSG